MNGMQAFACISDVDLALIEESMALFEPEAQAGAAVRRRHSGLGQFMSGSWGVALLCAVVSLSVLAAIVWAGRMAPITPPDVGISDTETTAGETEPVTYPEETTDATTVEGEETEAATPEESESETLPETEGVLHPDVAAYGVLFLSNGDGTCRIKGEDKNYTGRIIVPETSPYGDRVTEVVVGAFKSFRSIREVELPETVTVIGTNAFQGCASLKRVKLPSAVTEFGRAMFDGCGELERVDLPAGLTEIPAMTFQTCVSLYQVTAKDGITAIGANAFNGCRSLGTLTLPAGLRSIGSQAFLNCCGLYTVYYGGSEAEWSQVEVNPTGNSRVVSVKVEFGR